MKVILIVLDSVGIGAAPDAAEYGDAGANTLGHIAQAIAGGLRMPNLQRMGLGNIPALLPDGLPLAGVPPAEAPLADYGAMREISPGKDTTTGHWEIAGLVLEEGFTLLPPGPASFPETLTAEFSRLTGRGILGNKAASGTAIIQELGEQQMQTGAWIVYTSADSVMQIAAHEDIIPLEELYRACDIARKLCNPLRIGRVIARPYIGRPGNFQRTTNRRDYSFPPPGQFVMERLVQAGIPVSMIGKLEDIYAGRGFTQSFHTGNNRDSQQKTLELATTQPHGLIMANFIDFDMLYGHRRDTEGYANALEQADAFFGELLPLLDDNSRLIITADHGNDPTFTGTDHTREYVPLLVYQPKQLGKALGIRQGFFDIAQTLTVWFGLPPWPRGKPLTGSSLPCCTL
jgi:phosphopentomutase